MKVRLHGTPAEVDRATRRLVQVLDVVSISEPYPDRGASVLVRVYLEVRLDPASPTQPAPPAGPEPVGPPHQEGAAMRVVILARLGGNQHSGLELDRAYRVHAGPDPGGRVLVFDDHHTGFRWVASGEYREVADPLDRHDLVRIDHGPGGWRPVCSCVWRWHRGWSDPDEAAHAHGVHQRHMASQRRLLTQPVPPPLLAWIEQLRARRRQEPER